MGKAKTPKTTQLNRSETSVATNVIGCRYIIRSDNPAPLPSVATPQSLKKVKGRHDPKEALRIARTALAADQQRGVFQGLDGVLKGSLFLYAFCGWQVH